MLLAAMRGILQLSLYITPMIKTIYNYICFVCLGATAGPSKGEAMPAAIDWPADFDPAAGLKKLEFSAKKRKIFFAPEQ